MSRIIQLGDHLWQLPPMPETQDEVLYSKLSQGKQYWRRDNDYPEEFFLYSPATLVNSEYTRRDDNTGALTHLSREDTARILALREREMRRRWEGVWFMNDGEPTYLTGNHYFQLQWGAVKDYENPYTGQEYGEYREYMRDYQYFRQMCLESVDNHGQRNCSGFLLVKPKKTAITNTEALNFLNESTMTRSKNFGMMSKSLEDAMDTNFAYYMYGFNRLPYVFQPTVAQDNLKKIVFGNPRIRPTGSQTNILARLDNSKGFNTTVFTKGLVANAFDGPIMYRYWNDEWTKFEDPYPMDVYKKTSETVKKQESIQGLGIWTAYVSETDGKGFLQAKELMENSLLETMSKDTGRTKSELFYYFISADVAGDTSFDVYGKADTSKNVTRIQARIKQLEDDPQGLQAFTRQSPRTSDDAWRQGGGGGSVYNNVRLGKQLSAIRTRLNIGDLPYKHGKLEWVTVPMGLVKFVETSEEDKMKGVQGPCRLYLSEYLTADAFNRPFRLNMRDDNGLLMPGEDTPFIGATDPTEYAFKSDVKTPSQCASTVMNFNNPTFNSLWGKVVTRRFVFSYLHRHESPAKTLEDIIMKILFFGCYEAPEGNRQWLYTKLIEAGLQNFLLYRDPKTRSIEPYNHRKHQDLIRTVVAGRQNTIDDYVRSTSLYYAPPTGDDPDYLELMEEDRILQQHMSFDTSNTKIYDMGVCGSYNMMVLEAFEAWHKGKQVRESDLDQRSLELAFEYLVNM